MSFNINNNIFLHILLFIIAFGILIASGSLYRYVYNYNLIMFVIMLVMASVIFYQIFIPVSNSSTSTNLISHGYNINYSGLILLMFFIFFPIMSDVFNQVESYEITYFHIAILFLSFLIGAQSREKILKYYLKLMVIFSFISLFYFFAELFSELPSFIPYYGIHDAPPMKSHFYYLWSSTASNLLFIRNQSIFFEPGAFGFHLIIATLLSYKEKKIIFIIILVTAAITTFSTTVYIFLSLLLIYQIFFSNNRMRLISIILFCFILILILVRLVLGNFEIPLFILNSVFDKFDFTSAAYASMKERTLFVTESFNLFMDNFIIGAGHYSAAENLHNIGSPTSGLTGLLAEFGIFGILCILLYIYFFKHFKLFAIPITFVWLNGEYLQYSPISLFILTYMICEIGQKLFPIKNQKDIVISL